MLKTNIYKLNKIIATLSVSSAKGPIKYEGPEAADVKRWLEAEEFQLWDGDTYRTISATKTPVEFVTSAYMVLFGSYYRASKPLWENDGGDDIKKALPDAYSVEFYDYVDDVFNKAGLSIPGNHPQGTKTIGKQIEATLYTSLKQILEDYIAGLSSTKPQYQVINELVEAIRMWQKQMVGRIDQTFEELYVRGMAAGIVDAGVLPALGMADQMAMEFIKQNPNRIGSRIMTFAEDMVEKFRPIIARAYTPEGEFDVRALTAELHKVTPAQRYKLERIVRTETASISNYGRLLGWEKDPDKYYYKYHWNAAPDNRAKVVSIWRMQQGPYTFDEIKFLWENQEQLFAGKWVNDVYNQRCSISRAPLDEEYRGNRFAGSQDFRRTL